MKRIYHEQASCMILMLQLTHAVLNSLCLPFICEGKESQVQMDSVQCKGWCYRVRSAWFAHLRRDRTLGKPCTKMFRPVYFAGVFVIFCLNIYIIHYYYYYYYY